MLGARADAGVVREGASRDAARELFRKHRIERIVVVEDGQRLKLTQEQMDLETELEGLSARVDISGLESSFIKIAKAYSERFGQYGGQTLTIGKVSIRGGAQVVESKLNQTSGQPIKIEWEVKGGRITDVKIEGVSMVGTRRSDYKSYISNHGNRVEPLIEELEQRAKSR